VDSYPRRLNDLYKLFSYRSDTIWYYYIYVVLVHCV